ncbi:MAG: tetratricopeptide repeat protein [Acidobacteriota bacterium]|nr:tetratricopeptide repeat protein [Acidobacteriota bacterium]
MPVPESGRRVRFGVFEADLRSGELYKQGLKIKLQDQPFQILALLLERPGELVTRQELRDRLWSADTFVDFDVGLNTAVRRLRDALGDDAETPRFIETLHRRGYRFLAPVHWESESMAAQAAPGADAKTAPHAGQAPTGRHGKRQIRLAWIAVAPMVALLVAFAVPPVRHVFLPSGAARIQSIAVLPLENLSGDPGQEYFADGMTDALITHLARIGPLRVISRTSVMPYKAARKPLAQIARELNVDAIVEGSVVRSGNRVRINAELFQSVPERQLWANAYERNMADVLALEDEVARAVAAEIQIKLTPQERARLDAERPVQPAAYEAYLRGRYFWNLRTVDGVKKSVAYFQEAIQDDPNSPLPYAGLADAYNIMGFGVIHLMDSNEAGPKAVAAADKALALDDSLAEAHTALAFALHRFEGDWAGAEREYRWAIQLNANYALAHMWYGHFLFEVRRTKEACDEFDRARDLDPINPNVAQWLADCLVEGDRFDQAISLLQKTIEFDPNQPNIRWALGDLYERQGKYPEAIQQYEKGGEVNGRDSYMLALLASAHAASGNSAEAVKLLREMKRREGKENPYLFALVYARMGRTEEALRYLEKAYAEHSWGMILLRQEWRFDPLRSDPRFQNLLRRLNYPEIPESK